MSGAGAMLVDLEYIRREKDGRLYVRRHGRSIRLRQKPGTAAFLDEYQLALQKLEAAAPAPKLTLTAPAKDSFRWLVPTIIVQLSSSCWSHRLRKCGAGSSMPSACAMAPSPLP